MARLAPAWGAAGFVAPWWLACALRRACVGMRSGISLALVIVIVAETVIGSTDGLRQRVINTQMVFAMPEMYAAIFAAGVLGYGLNLASLPLERRFVHWSGK